MNVFRMPSANQINQTKVTVGWWIKWKWNRTAKMEWVGERVTELSEKIACGCFIRWNKWTDVFRFRHFFFLVLSFCTFPSSAHRFCWLTNKWTNKQTQKNRTRWRQHGKMSWKTQAKRVEWVRQEKNRIESSQAECRISIETRTKFTYFNRFHY